MFVYNLQFDSSSSEVGGRRRALRPIQRIRQAMTRMENISECFANASVSQMQIEGVDLFSSFDNRTGCFFRRNHIDNLHSLPRRVYSRSANHSSMSTSDENDVCVSEFM